MGRMVAMKARPAATGDAEFHPFVASNGAAVVDHPNLAVRIHNLDEIGRAYGAGAKRAAADHVTTVLKFPLRGGDHPGLAEYVLRRLSERPVAYDGQRFHLVVSLAPTSANGGCANIASTVHGNPAFPDDAWCRSYRADMALAVNLFDAMAEGRIALAWQPVRNADDPSQIMYHECLLRTVDPQATTTQGAINSAGPMIEALERLGLVRALDRYIMAEAIEELRGDASREIAVNISAQSMVEDHWWINNLDALAQSPPIGRRLYIEITETALFPSMADAADFARRLRSFGCQIVLDDFGTGHAAIRSILALDPEVVKIDKFFVHHAKLSEMGRRTLAHMIGLAESLGALVVVEGVESAADSRMAREAGARWQQGYHLGLPSISRPWRVGAAGVSPIRGAEAIGYRRIAPVSTTGLNGALPQLA